MGCISIIIVVSLIADHLARHHGGGGPGLSRVLRGSALTLMGSAVLEGVVAARINDGTSLRWGVTSVVSLILAGVGYSLARKNGFGPNDRPP